MTLCFVVEGQKKFGMKKEFDKEYIDETIARFEFDCFKPVSQYVTLYKKYKNGNLENIEIYIDI